MAFIEAVAAVVIQTAYRRHVARQMVAWMIREDARFQRQREMQGMSRSNPSITKQAAVNKRTMKSKPMDLYNRAAILIQAVFRGFWARDCLNVDNYCATAIQRVYRGYHARLNYQFDMYRIVTIQSVWRRSLVRERVAYMFAYAILIQSVARKFLAQRAYRRHQVSWMYLTSEDAAATVIQSQWRMFSCWYRYTELLYVVIIQSVVRGWLARKRVALLRAQQRAHLVHNARRRIANRTASVGPESKAYFSQSRQASQVNGPDTLSPRSSTYAKKGQWEETGRQRGFSKVQQVSSESVVSSSRPTNGSQPRHTAQGASNKEVLSPRSRSLFQQSQGHKQKKVLSPTSQSNSSNHFNRPNRSTNKSFVPMSTHSSNQQSPSATSPRASSDSNEKAEGMMVGDVPNLPELEVEQNQGPPEESTDKESSRLPSWMTEKKFTRPPGANDGSDAPDSPISEIKRDTSKLPSWMTEKKFARPPSSEESPSHTSLAEDSEETSSNVPSWMTEKKFSKPPSARNNSDAGQEEDTTSETNSNVPSWMTEKKFSKPPSSSQEKSSGTKQLPWMRKAKAPAVNNEKTAQTVTEANAQTENATPVQEDQDFPVSSSTASDSRKDQETREVVQVDKGSDAYNWAYSVWAKKGLLAWTPNES